MKNGAGIELYRSLVFLEEFFEIRAKVTARYAIETKQVMQHKVAGDFGLRREAKCAGFSIDQSKTVYSLVSILSTSVYGIQSLFDLRHKMLSYCGIFKVRMRPDTSLVRQRLKIATSELSQVRGSVERRGAVAGRKVTGWLAESSESSDASDALRVDT